MKQHQELREMLVDRKRQINKALTADIDSLKEGSRTITSDGAADSAAEAAEFELNSQLAEVESRELQAVSEAIARIDAGTYGVCDDCEKPIAQPRLEALPYAIRCIKCQGEYEKDSANRDWTETAYSLDDD